MSGSFERRWTAKMSRHPVSALYRTRRSRRCATDDTRQWRSHVVTRSALRSSVTPAAVRARDRRRIFHDGHPSLGQFAPELRAELVQLPIRGAFVIDLVAVEPRDENVVETAHAAKKYVLVFCG